jgi:predicted HicB family RNase H-like nuclease
MTMSLRIQKRLHAAITDYAQRKGISVTQITLDYYRHLLDQENEQDAEQV